MILSISKTISNDIQFTVQKLQFFLFKSTILAEKYNRKKNTILCRLTLFSSRVVIILSVSSLNET